MDWLKEARETAAQCWCDSATRDREMDTALAEAFTGRLAFWMREASRNQRNADYYRGLLVRCGEAIGHAAYVADDGSVMDDVLCAKVPELVEAILGQASPAPSQTDRQSTP